MYLVKEISEVFFRCWQPIVFIAVQLLLENDDVTVHQLFENVLKRPVEVFNAFKHVWLDLLEQHQLKVHKNVTNITGAVVT